MKIIFVCGPWGSGTSAVTNILLRLGSVGLTPYYITSDPKTGNSYESIVFRKLLLSLASERTFSVQKKKDVVLAEFKKFQDSLRDLVLKSEIDFGKKPIVLKHTLSCLFLEEIDEVFDAQFIFVRRSIDEIEAGRMRRKWSSFFGAEGARKAFSEMDKFLYLPRQNVFTIEYQGILDDPIGKVENLAAFCGLINDRTQIEYAINAVRQHSNYQNKTNAV
jgi:Sulfotransferase family